MGDLPAGPFRSRLSPVIEVRALLPLVCVTSRETTATSRDGGGKTRVTVLLREVVKVDGHEDTPATWSAEVVPVAGYAKDTAKAVDALSLLGLLPRPVPPLELVAEAAGIDVAGFTASPTVALGNDEPASEAFRRVLANLADAVEANWQGTVDDLDPEFLHDLRVVVRRTRSVLAEGKNVLPAAVRDTYREGFGWLGSATGRARDLDVYVIEWADYVGALGRQGAAALEPVLDHITRQRHSEHATLARTLRSSRYRDLMSGWRSWLEEPTIEGIGRHADQPVGRVAAALTKRAQARLLARGRSIAPETPAEELHELRKDAKKLRYLLECFGSVYSSRARKEFVQRLKSLQDNLGEHQDTEVHVGELRAISGDLHGSPGIGPETLVAMGRLTEHLERRRAAAREEFAERFAAYDTKQTRLTFEELLGSAGRPS